MKGEQEPKTVTVINQCTDKPIEVEPITTVKHIDGTVYEIEPTLSHVTAVMRAVEQREAAK